MPRSLAEYDELVERARVALRHRAFRLGLRDGERWLDAANRAPARPGPY